MPNQGPQFQRVEEIDWQEIDRQDGFGSHNKPLPVKGAVRAWPAWQNWSFKRLAELRHADSTEAIVKFQNGLVEQGLTCEGPYLLVSPHLQELTQSAEYHQHDDVGLISNHRLRQIKQGEHFTLN